MKNDVIISVLEEVKSQLFEISDDFISLPVGAPYFDDSCKVVEARHEIMRLLSALKLASDYAKD